MVKNTVAIITAALLLGYVSNACAQDTPDENAVKTEQQTRQVSQNNDKQKPKINTVRTAAFYLRDGRPISGKLLSDEKNQITVEELLGSNIVVSAYNKKEIDSRTLTVKKVPEYNYYIQLAEYFSGRTWDFSNDPDDFIQAIRCYEKAKQSITQIQDPDGEKIEQLNRSLEKLHADRNVWIKEVESRAQLKKLELEAQLESIIKDLKDKVDAGIRRIDESIEKSGQTAADVEDNYKKLQDDIADMDKRFTSQLNLLQKQIEDTRRMIEDNRRHPWLYAPRRPHRDSAPTK